MKGIEQTIKLNLAAFGNLFRSKPENLLDQELIALDFNLHSAWDFGREGHRIHFGPKNWGFQDLLDRHIDVRREMDKRAFIHNRNDELDKRTLPLLIEETQTKKGSMREPKKPSLVNTDEFPNLVFDEEGVEKFYKRGDKND